MTNEMALLIALVCTGPEDKKLQMKCIGAVRVCSSNIGSLPSNDHPVFKCLRQYRKKGKR